MKAGNSKWVYLLLRFKWPLIGLPLIFFSQTIRAQFPDQQPVFDEFGQDTTQNQPLDQEGVNRLLLPDTAVLYYFHADDLSETKVRFDTVLNNVWKFSPARRQKLPHAVAGILGGASFPMFYNEAYRRGVDIGFHQYDLYQKEGMDIKFYESESGYTDARYTAVGNDQRDGFLEVEWGRKFEDGYVFSAEANRIFQTGSANHFNHQAIKQYNFLVGAGYAEKDSPYKAFLLYAGNSSEAEENGGIPFEDPDAATPFSEETVTTSGFSRSGDQAFSLLHYLGFFGKPDAAGQKRNFTLSHQLTYRTADYRFSETNPSVAGIDSTYYNAFPFDDRGIRFYLEHVLVQNKIALQTFKNNRNKGRNDLFEIGIDHQFHRIRQSPDSSIFNNLFLFGNWKIKPRKSLKFNALAHFGVLKNAGDYRLEANTEINYDDWAKLTGSFVNQLYEPSLVQEQLNVNFISVWDRDFKKTLSTSVKGDLELPKLNLNLGLNYHLLNNFVYFDTLSFAKQTEVPISVLQFYTRLNLKLGKFYLDNLVGIQTVSERFLSLPNFYGESSLYFKDYIFKNKMGFKIGVDARLLGSYKPLTYNPVTGQFHLQESQTIRPYPALTGFVILKRKRFQFFLLSENFQEFFGASNLINNYGQRYYYEVANYPFAGNSVRFGVQWELFN